MLDSINLAGLWNLQLDAQKHGLKQPYKDSMHLPDTTSHARKGEQNEEVQIGALTDEYAFEGFAWFAKEIEVPARWSGRPCKLFLERTRVTTVWIDDIMIGTQNSLSTPHCYDLISGLSAGKHILTIRVDNTDYPTKGGHLTSADTQTNWNGITGRMELQFFGDAYLEDIQAFTDVKNRAVTLVADVIGAYEGTSVAVSAESFNGDCIHVVEQQAYTLQSKKVEIAYVMGADALLWSESHPYLYKLRIQLLAKDGEMLDSNELVIGLRDFKAEGDKFTINGRRTFLRGKHDGLIFPLTGYAPTDVQEWIRILRISQSYGINHYRFHTCCPPEAAFIAADMLGIYMEPELPFWGTITDESDEQHNQAEQDYLVSEGFAMLKAFGNHPSFVMMSLGNELWGSKERLNGILKAYKAYDKRHLYTQGSNNFQFVPVILEEDDFFCGVRFSRERLFRGSYAMCDAPLGHVQTDKPNTLKDYDEQIFPEASSGEREDTQDEGSIQIQYGTGTKTVKASAGAKELVPHVPVISHEIGQYATFPNFGEIEKYAGPLKAKNFEVFRERLEAKGLGHLADKYFECSGQLAVACYKEELEAAFRSKRLAGFQLLDLQDFSGQGTALVGILDAFMDSKGMITPEEWRSFCSDAVLLARFEKFNYGSGEAFAAEVELSYYREESLAGRKLRWELRGEQASFSTGEAEVPAGSEEGNYLSLCRIDFMMPRVAKMTKAKLSLMILGTDIHKTYDLWIYPECQVVDFTGIQLVKELSQDVITLLENGEDVVLMPPPGGLSNAIEGLYSTDFWCYPMFRSISESMNKPVPVGTMGLLIDKEHPMLKDFPSEEYSTYPWWNIVMHSGSIIMDDLPGQLQPIVQTIDNFERNHKLGLIFEFRVLNGRVMFSALDYDKMIAVPEGRQLLYSMVNYMKSDAFHPEVSIPLDVLQGMLHYNT
ncbi:beta-glucuronidase [Paenibacillus sp. HJL G12]|uniref:Beta-glucuronidase n=1 Tax=Paenibacillus dendrobii TaxID=2691084 RepID=A0A7X3IEU0_9BACL|nr:glycoside hydrolase family 2 TIM barrel-domain containing protein [Paenibacillus dendrobii]MWV42176.1 beta-glucuronidase [Paenibacillus dendrobii]